MSLHRRMFLRAMGVAVAAPALTALIGSSRAKSTAEPYRIAIDPIHNPNATDCHNIIFMAKNKEIVRLNHQGMYYKGDYVKDVGEAYRLFCEAMYQMGAKYP